MHRHPNLDTGDVRVPLKRSAIWRILGLESGFYISIRNVELDQQKIWRSTIVSPAEQVEVQHRRDPPPFSREGLAISIGCWVRFNLSSSCVFELHLSFHVCLFCGWLSVCTITTATTTTTTCARRRRVWGEPRGGRGEAEPGLGIPTLTSVFEIRSWANLCQTFQRIPPFPPSSLELKHTSDDTRKEQEERGEAACQDVPGLLSLCWIFWIFLIVYSIFALYQDTENIRSVWWSGR